MSKQKKINLFSLTMFIGFASYALLFTQVIPYLTEIGYSVTQRGYIMAFLAVLSMGGQIYAGYLSDKHHTIKRFFVYVTWMYLGAGSVVFAFDRANFWFHFFIIGFVASLTRVLANIFETWILEVDGLYDEFGRIRTFGSFGWAVASLAAGYLAVFFGFKSLGIINGVLSLVVIFMTFKMEDAQKEHTVKIEWRDTITLFKNKNYVLILVIYIIAYFVYNADGIIVTDLIYALGGNSSDVGLRWFVHALSEMPMLLIVGRLLLKYRSKKLMLFASAIIAIKFGLFSIAPNVFTIHLITILQMISFPFLLISQKDLVNREVPKHLRTSGQMVAISLCSGMSAIFSPIVSSYLIEATSLATTFRIFGFMMIIPIILMLGYKEHETL